MATSPPSDWAQFIQQNLSGEGLRSQTTPYNDQELTNAMMGGRGTITTNYTQGDDAIPPSSNLNPQGRVAKPSRRRSRASRRTPTTLVNTDASNFRAMVQQFTGGPPAAPYAAAGPQYHAEPSISFGFGMNQQILNSLHAQQQQQQQVRNQQQQQYLFGSPDNNHDGTFLERSYNS